MLLSAVDPRWSERQHRHLAWKVQPYLVALRFGRENGACQTLSRHPTFLQGDGA